MTPTICCIFRHTTPLGVDADQLVRTLDDYVSLYLGPAWGVACELVLGHQRDSDWTLYFLDDADQAGVLGYHHDPDGSGPLTPRGFVFVKPTLASGTPLSVTASHELAEMIVNPAANMGALSPRGRWCALEVCDPVQRTTFEVNGLPMSNFVTPAWFGRPGGVFDHLGLCRQAWQILPGGYIPVTRSSEWSQLFGSTQTRKESREKDTRFRRGAKFGRKRDTEAALVSDRRRSSVQEQA